MSIHPDNKFLTALLENDERLIRELYQTCKHRTVSLIKSMGGTSQEGDDIFQDAIMVIYRKAEREGLFLTCNINTFLHSVSRNIWLKKKRDEKEYALDPSFDEIADPTDIHRLMVQNDCYELFRHYFQQLGDECQAILKKHFMKARDKETAEIYHISVNTLKKRRFDCKKRLIKWIQDDDDYKKLIE